jgi:EmrB/QacA subfamily drug resistance transporter
MSSAKAAADSTETYSHGKIMVVMGALMLVLLMAALDQTIVATALPRIATELHGLDKLAWVASAYLLTSAISTPVYGKLGDLFGRKRIFQIAIVIFLAGSVLCGLAQDMNQLVAARAFQGAGAGGLISLVLAIIGDVIPPRQRGKYMGYFGAVFGVASVAGPLLGGLLTDALSWRWIFYVNLPIGAAALSVVATRLHLPVRKSDRKIDYIGVALLATSTASLLLATVWGGSTYAWGSQQIIGLIGGGLILAAAFVLWERRAPEPIMPLHLFRNRIFNVSVILSFLTGVAMFASILYIPVYQQTVRGYTPTESGLLMLPLVVGMLIASVTSGQLTSKLGRYKIFPIIGTLVLALGFWLFSHLSLTTSEWVLGAWMLVVGLGIGMFVQIMTLAIQNAVERSEMGVATSTSTFFRSLGSSFGGAIFGAIFVNRLSAHLTQEFPGVSTDKINIHNVQGGAPVHDLPPETAHRTLEAFVSSFHDMFLIAVLVALIAFVVALFLKEIPLRDSQPAG